MNAEVRQFSKEQINELPRGQRLLKAGFKLITEEGIWGILDFDSLMNQRIDEVWKDIVEKYPTQPILNYIHKARSWWDICFTVPNGGAFGILSQEYTRTIYVLELQYIELENYTRKEIPDRCLEKIREAKELGADNFYVVEPGIRNIDDPVIVSKLEENEYLYITHWGDND